MMFLTEGAASAGVVSAITSALSTVASDAQSAIASVLPIALPIMGAVVVVGIGIRVFKKVTGK